MENAFVFRIKINIKLVLFYLLKAEGSFFGEEIID